MIMYLCKVPYLIRTTLTIFGLASEIILSHDDFKIIMQNFSYYFTQLGLDTTLAASFYTNDSAERMIEEGRFYRSATIRRE